MFLAGRGHFIQRQLNVVTHFIPFGISFHLPLMQIVPIVIADFRFLNNVSFKT